MMFADQRMSNVKDIMEPYLTVFSPFALNF